MPHTCSAASRSKPPTKTPSRANSVCSVRRQQVVGPVDQRAQRLLPLLQHACAAGQDLVAVLQPRVDVGHRQRPHARGRQFERQRNAFEPRDQFGHGWRLRRVERERRLVLLRARDEQPHRGRLRHVGDAGAARRQRQRMHRIALLAGHVQRLAAGREQAHVRRRAQDGVRQFGRGLDQVLAVVEDDQHAPRLQVRADRLQQRAVGLRLHAHHLCRLGDHVRVVAQRRQVEEPDAVRKLVHQFRGDLQRQPGLAEAAHAEQRQQARLVQIRLDLVEFASRGR